MGPNTTNALIWGTVATAVVSLLSLSGACVLPLITGASRQRWMQFFIAMAVSTLSADVFLHLLPAILGLHDHSAGHSHEHGHGDHHDDHELEHPEYHHNHSHNGSAEEHAAEARWYSRTEERDRLLWMSLVLAAVYVVYFFEFVVFYRKRHTHHPEKVAQCPAHDEQRIVAGHSVSESDVSLNSSREDSEKGATTCCGLTSRAVIILFGDGIHNFVDGVGIGTSFLTSTQLGLVTSIAVVCHEMPHELGDLAVLLDSGLSMSKALLLNLASALTAFAGLYLSILLQSSSTDGTVERVLLTLTAGMFLYVAWIDMLGHLKYDSPTGDHWILVCALQYAGFAVGFLVIFAIGWFEHDLFHATN